MYIDRGEGTLIAGDYVGRFQPGDLYIIGSGLPHVFRSDQSYYKGKSTCRSISLYFDERYFGKELWGANELSAFRKFAEISQRGLQLTGPDLPEASGVTQSLITSSGFDKVLLFFSLLRIIVESKSKKMLALQSGKLLTSEETRMNSIIEFTFRESHRKIYLTEVASLASLSVEAFCRYFKLHTRKTYITFLNEVRVSNACRLLIQKNFTIQQICYQTGFTNVSNFNRIFKRFTGKSPLTFRKQLPFSK